jgi:phage terminase large subunit-like protein
MGLRGKGAAPLRAKKEPKRRKAPAKRLSMADQVISFIGRLKLTTGRHAGTRFRLRPWQRDIVRGLYREKAGKRIVRTGLVTCGRKNGKTTFCAALAAAHLLGPAAEPRGECYSAASDRNQAARIFRELEAMILADDSLANRCNIQRFGKKIEVLSGDGAGSIYEALSSDARKAHSLSPSFVVCDELAQWPSRELYDNLVTGTGARENPLTVVISTMSSDPNHVLSELIDYGRRVNSGEIVDPAFKAWIFTTPLNVDIWDESNWYSANPALDDFRSLDELRKYAEQAQKIPARESVFRNLYLNMPVSAESRFIAESDWAACEGPVIAEQLRGHTCIAAMDLSATQDLTALVLFFPDDGGAAIPYFWLPQEQLAEREHQDRVPYQLWQREGLLLTTPGRAIDKATIVKKLGELSGGFNIRLLMYDRWNAADLQKIMDAEGVSVPIHPHGQGYKDMAPAVNELERRILNRELIHPGHPILNWNCANTVVEMDAAGNRKLSKRRSTARIDGMVCLAMAVAGAAIVPEPQGSIYDDPNIGVWT